MGRERRSRGAVGSVGLLVALSASTLACCTCGQAGPVDGGGRGREARRPVLPAWLEVCLPAPARAYGAARRLGGETLGAFSLPGAVDELAARLTGIPEDELARAVDFDRPLTFLILEPGEGRPLAESVALVATRGDGAGSSGRRDLETPGGATYRLAAEGELVALARSDVLVESALAAARAPCAGREGEAPDAAVEVAAGLLGERGLRGWVDGRAARLEASARREAARRGPSTLGDPEALARGLGRWAGSLLARLEAAAPLRAELDLEPERFDLVVRASRSGDGQATAEPAETTPRELLALVPPDAYLVVATRATAGERVDAAAARVGELGRVAGEGLLSAEERRRMEDAARRLAATLDGWVVVALRPGREAGPLVLVAVAETRDGAAAGRALADLVALAGEGYLQGALENLGAAVRIDGRDETTEGGALRLAASTPSWVEGDRGAVLRTLLGAAPTLAYRIREGRLLVAAGPEPEAELARMEEAAGAGSGAGPSVLAQPVLEPLVAPRPGESLLLYAWVPDVASLLTRGAPGPTGMPLGGIALAQDRPGGLGRLVLGLDAAQVRSLLSALSPRREP